MPRFWEIDALRGIAIIMMVVFHLLWDLNYFGYIQLSLYTGFFGIFQIATAGLFLLLAGLVATISAKSHEKGYSLHFLKRGAFIIGTGFLITIVTFLFFPSEFVYFGILQLIGTAIILSIPIIEKRIIPLFLAAIVIALPLLYNLQSVGINWLVWVGFAIPKATLDFEPIFPWFGAFLIGIFIGNTIYQKDKRIFRIPELKNWFAKKLQFLGRHSLVIYLVHQPILFGILFFLPK